jgi:hypothetical protein
MFSWWQRFLAIPDGQRAEILAKMSVWTIIVLLYVLGGVSLYLRHKYLTPTTSPTPVETITRTPTEQPTPPRPTETLYPSRTPKPAGAEIDVRNGTKGSVLTKTSNVPIESVI